MTRSALPPLAIDRPTVRVMKAADLPFVARVHTCELPGGFFADLGEGFLQAYYLSFIASPVSVALIAEIGGTPAGFLVGTVDHAEHTRHVARHHRTRLVTAGTLALLRRPKLTGKLVTTRLGRYTNALRRARRPVTGPAPARRIGVLSALAVAPEVRRSGSGRKLLTSYVGIATLSGTHRLELMSRKSSDATEHFYPSLGWKREPQLQDRDGKFWIPFSRELCR